MPPGSLTAHVGESGLRGGFRAHAAPRRAREDVGRHGLAQPRLGEQRSSRAACVRFHVARHVFRERGEHDGRATRASTARCVSVPDRHAPHPRHDQRGVPRVRPHPSTPPCASSASSCASDTIVDGVARLQQVARELSEPGLREPRVVVHAELAHPPRRGRRRRRRMASTAARRCRACPPAVPTARTPRRRASRRVAPERVARGELRRRVEKPARPRGVGRRIHGAVTEEMIDAGGEQPVDCGFAADGDSRKFSRSEVDLLADASGHPVTCAADNANHPTTTGGSGSTLTDRRGAQSQDRKRGQAEGLGLPEYPRRRTDRAVARRACTWLRASNPSSCAQVTHAFT